MHEDLTWRQVARFIKFKQSVEGDGTRFSKPHITLLTVHGLMQTKVLLRKGSVILDADVSSFIRLCDVVIKNWVQSGFLEESAVNMVREILYAPKLHLIGGHVRSVNDSSVILSQQMSADEEDGSDMMSTSGRFEDVIFLG